MKRFLALILSVLLFMPIVEPLADDNNDNIYNEIMDNGTILGKDNLGDNSDKNIFPQMSNGSVKTINNIVILIRFKGEKEFINNSNIDKLLNTYNLYEDRDFNNVAD